MNLSLDNPYGDVSIPRAKLRPYGDHNAVIINPMTLESSYNNNSAPNPYENLKSPGEVTSSGVPVYGDVRDGNQHPPSYNSQGTYIVKEDAEQFKPTYIKCLSVRMLT
ncbi:hypothetical protein P4O66_002828 [Electrophorus voltai]|uniref:Uncharacterized protein n=1 Tax=Electrophorus voltai TaxID=2609070 RepID=A0AAD9DNY1_9TELE|nr:hypothetical protein P4O66_002828 [Electrophorus voltai]